MADKQKQKYKNNRKQYRENMADEERQKKKRLSKTIQRKYGR